MDFPTLTTLLGQFGAADPMMASPYGPLGQSGAAAPMPPSAAQQAAQGQASPPMPAGANPAAMNAAVNAQAPQLATPPAGPTLYQRIMAGLFHTPSALQGAISPEDQRTAQSQALLQMGARMMGAGLPPGSHSHFGMNLANALQGAQPAYEQGIMGALQAQQAGMGLAQAKNQWEARQQLGALTPPGADATLPQQIAYYNQALQYALKGSLPEATALAWGLRSAQAALAKEQGGSSRDVDTLSWGGYTIRRDKNTGQVESPIDVPSKGIKAGDWVSPGTLGQAPLTQEQAASLSDREKQEAFREASTRFDKWNADKTVAKMEDTKRNLDRLDGMLSGAAANGQLTSDIPIMLARIMHEGGVGRQGLIQQLSHIDSSLPGRLDAWASKNTTGTLPPYQIKKVQEVVAGLRGLDAIEYEDKRNKYIKAWGDRIGGLDSMIPTTRTQYGLDPRDATPDEQKLAAKDPNYKWYLQSQAVRVQ